MIGMRIFIMKPPKKVFLPLIVNTKIDVSTVKKKYISQINTGSLFEKK